MHPEAPAGFAFGSNDLEKTCCIAVHFLFYVLDINECENSSTCHPRANCSNTEGSFSCQCEKGYTGDGIFNCTGNIKYFKKFLVLENADAEKTRMIF